MRQMERREWGGIGEISLSSDFGEMENEKELPRGTQRARVRRSVYNKTEGEP